MMIQHRFLTLRDGTELHIQVKESGKPMWLVVTHGICEHLERHNYLREIVGAYFNIIQYDLRGHGRSHGRRGYIDSFDTFTDDLKEIVAYLKKNYDMKSYGMFGHSMGGLITAKYIQECQAGEDYPKAAYLSSPCVATGNWLGQALNLTPRHFTRFLAAQLPTFKMPGLLDVNDLSHDPQVAIDFKSNDLNIMAPHLKLLFNLVDSARTVFSRKLNLKCPLAVSVGTKDKIVSPSDIRHYFKTIEKVAVLTEFEGAYHEIHNEIEKYRKPYLTHVTNTLLEWLY